MDSMLFHSEELSGIHPLKRTPPSSLQSTPSKTPQQCVVSPSNGKLRDYLNSIVVDSPGVSPIKHEQPPGWNGFNSAPPSVVSRNFRRLPSGDAGVHLPQSVPTTRFNAEKTKPFDSKSRSLTSLTQFNPRVIATVHVKSGEKNKVTFVDDLPTKSSPSQPPYQPPSQRSPVRQLFVDSPDSSLQSILSKPTLPKSVAAGSQIGKTSPGNTNNTSPGNTKFSPINTSPGYTKFGENKTSSSNRQTSPNKPVINRPTVGYKPATGSNSSIDAEIDEMIGRSGTSLKSLRRSPSPARSPVPPTAVRRSPVPPVTLHTSDHQEVSGAVAAGGAAGAICTCELPKCCCNELDANTSENVATVAPRKRDSYLTPESYRSHEAPPVTRQSYGGHHGSCLSAISDASSVSIERFENVQNEPRAFSEQQAFNKQPAFSEQPVFNEQPVFKEQPEFNKQRTFYEPRAFIVRNNGEIEEEIERAETPEKASETATEFLQLSPGMRAAEQTIQQNQYNHNMDPQDYENVTSFDICEMEGVRNHLHNMLKTSREAMQSPGRLQQQQQQHPEQHPPTTHCCTSPCKHPIHDGPNHYLAHQLDGDDVEPDVDLENAIGSWFGRHRHLQSENSYITENKVIRESLEREKYKRQHCEKQIRDLQQRLLETQEQLAVSVSTEKKKDIMIEQLDKTLGRVVEGWKKRESEKQTTIEKLRSEKDEIDTKQTQQQQVLKDFQQDLEKALKNLEAEQNKVAELEKYKIEKLAQLDIERAQLTEQLETESERADKFESDYLKTKESRERLEKQNEKLKEQMKDEKEGWLIQDKKYQNKIDEINAAHDRALTTEKERLEEQTKLAKGAKEVITSLQLELQQIQIELDTTSRERDSLKVELGLQEARMESSKRKLETDLRAEFDKTISDKHSESHDRLLKRETELMENHRKQILEINSRHSDELNEQLTSVADEHRKREINYKEQIRQLEESLERNEEELRMMKTAKTKAERQRDWLSRSQPLSELRLPTAEQLESMEKDIDCTDGVHCDTPDNDDGYYSRNNNEADLVNRLQSMMQVHCDEALNVLTLNKSPEKRSTAQIQPQLAPSIIGQPNRQSDGYVLPIVTSSDESMFTSHIYQPQNHDASDTYRQKHDASDTYRQHHNTSDTYRQQAEVRRNISPDFDDVSEIPATEAESEATNYHPISGCYSNERLTDIGGRYPASARDELSSRRPGMYPDSGIGDSTFYANGGLSSGGGGYSSMKVGLYVGTETTQHLARTGGYLQNGRAGYASNRTDESKTFMNGEGSRYKHAGESSQRPRSPMYPSNASAVYSRDVVEDVHNEIPQIATMTGNYGDLNDRMKEHEVRQIELQQYIKTLLQQSPGSSTNGDVIENSSNTSSTQYQNLPHLPHSPHLPQPHSPPQRLHDLQSSDIMQSRQIQQQINSGKMEVEDILKCLKHLQDSGQIPPSSLNGVEQINVSETTQNNNQQQLQNGSHHHQGLKSHQERVAGSRLVSTNHAPQYSQATEVARVKLYAGRKQPPVTVATAKEGSANQRNPATNNNRRQTARKSNPVWR